MPFLDPEELKPKLREVFETQVVPQIKKANMKQTAVEWLVEHLNLDETSPNYNQWAVEQAKEMEEQGKVEFAFRAYSEMLSSGKSFVDIVNSMRTFKSE